MEDEADAATEAALRRTASDYDQTPYRSFPYPLTRPSHVAAIAHLLGLTTPDVVTARVLEIGCAGGGNIIPVAAAFPEARFVGVDLSPLQIAEARRRAGAAGLANIELREGSVTEVDASWGSFDYIICHGVYSWVPDEVRRAILRITAERLADTGAAVVSYNVLPGWHLRRVARDAMLAHAAQYDAPAERARQARSFLGFLAEHAPGDTPYGRVLRHEAAILRERSDDYVMHEFLEADNAPCTLTTFVAAAETAGLRYLGDAQAASLADCRDADPLEAEQHADLVSGRTFRQSILMKPAALASVRRPPEASRLAGLHVAAAFVDMPRPVAGPGPFSFKIRSPQSTEGFGTLTTDNTAIASALVALGNRWPSTTTADELIAAVAGETAATDSVTTPVLQMLFHLLTAGMLRISTAPIRVGGPDSRRPVALPLARADAVLGAAQTTNLHHRAVPIDPIGRWLLPLLDGSQDRDALAGVVQGMLDRGAIDLRGEPVGDVLDKAIRGLATSALLVP
jgi:SAM-dependent methyltransferase